MSSLSTHANNRVNFQPTDLVRRVSSAGTTSTPSLLPSLSPSPSRCRTITLCRKQTSPTRSSLLPLVPPTTNIDPLLLKMEINLKLDLLAFLVPRRRPLLLLPISLLIQRPSLHRNQMRIRSLLLPPPTLDSSTTFECSRTFSRLSTPIKRDLDIQRNLGGSLGSLLNFKRQDASRE